MPTDPTLPAPLRARDSYRAQTGASEPPPARRILGRMPPRALPDLRSGPRRGAQRSGLRWAPLALCLAVGGCATPGRPMAEIAGEINATLESGPLRLSAGDVLQVAYPGKSEWDFLATVRADGRASFPSIPELTVEGLTVEQLSQRLRTAYTGILPSPDLNLGVQTYGSRFVYVMGDVTSPGEFPLVGRLSLLEALGRAGGPLKPTALLEAVVLVRWVPEEKRQRTWTIDASPERWDGAAPILLQPYDVVFVPNTPIDDVDIWVDQYIRLMIPFPYLIPPVY